MALTRHHFRRRLGNLLHRFNSPRANRAGRCRSHSSLPGFVPQIERLEPRQMLSATLWVNDNWVDQTHPGASTPSYGDTMTIPAGQTAPNLGSGTLTYGVNAFDTIQAGVNAVADSGTVYVLPGTYTESDISLNHAVTVAGPTTGVASVLPAVADSHEVNRDDWLGNGTHNAFVISSSNVSLSNLTIDGGTGVGYFGGVMTDWTTGQT